MSDKPKIPDWQRPTTDSASPSPIADEPTPEQPAQAPIPTEEDLPSAEGDGQRGERTELLEQASRFLDDPAIRDASREKKVMFLESKGVGAEDIEELLGATPQEEDVSGLEEAGERAWLSVST